MKAPRFWNKQGGLLVEFLRPFGEIYGDIVRKRAARKPDYISKLPVICVGNVTMGGAGKTPVVQSIIGMLKDAGKHPAVLLRGYGRSSKGTITVDKETHAAKQVGDEALLHAESAAAVVVSADRVAGARAIDGDRWNTHIVMDDGLQNPSLRKNVSFLVVDGDNPFGNEEVFPAGPLREPVEDAVRRVQAMVVIGHKNEHLQTRFGFLMPLFQAHLTPVNMDDFVDKPVIAFAGIGNPQKFFATLKNGNVLVIDSHIFPDHYDYSERDIRHLKSKAAHIGAKLVTTRKDWVRLNAEQRQGVDVLDVVLQWEDEAAVKKFLQDKGVL